MSHLVWVLLVKSPGWGSSGPLLLESLLCHNWHFVISSNDRENSSVFIAWLGIEIFVFFFYCIHHFIVCCPGERFQRSIRPKVIFVCVCVFYGRKIYWLWNQADLAYIAASPLASLMTLCELITFFESWLPWGKNWDCLIYIIFCDSTKWGSITWKLLEVKNRGSLASFTSCFLSIYLHLYQFHSLIWCHNCSLK